MLLIVFIFYLGYTCNLKCKKIKSMAMRNVIAVLTAIKSTTNFNHMFHFVFIF